MMIQSKSFIPRSLIRAGNGTGHFRLQTSAISKPIFHRQRWQVENVRRFSDLQQKPPVYFSDPGTHQARFPATNKAPLPTYFSKPKGPQAPGLSRFPPQATATPRTYSWWARSIAYISFAAGLGISIYVAYHRAENTEEVPIVQRRRSNFYSDAVFAAELSAQRQLAYIGMPSLETLSKASLILKPDDEDDKVRLAYAIFDRLLKENDLTGVQLHVIDETAFHFSENRIIQGHIFLYKEALQEEMDMRTLPAHLAVLLAPEILKHRQESVSCSYVKTCNLIASLLLLPMSIVHPLTGLFILPAAGAFALEWTSGKDDERLEEEGDLVAMLFMHRAGFNVADILAHWGRVVGTAEDYMLKAVNEGREDATILNGELLYREHARQRALRRAQFALAVVLERYPKDVAEAQSKYPHEWGKEE